MNGIITLWITHAMMALEVLIDGISIGVLVPPSGEVLAAAV
jgi:hypothetical protein